MVRVSDMTASCLDAAPMMSDATAGSSTFAAARTA
jgi:hypothetical protein